MSQDIVADTLNQIMNAKRAKKETVVTTKFSKLLINLLEMMKNLGYLDYNLEDKKLVISLKDINKCKAIKPRYTVTNKTLERYIRRFLPARNFGYVIVSTNKGLMVHHDAQENKIGGSLIAYFY